MELNQAKNAVQSIFQALGVDLVPDPLLYNTQHGATGEFVASIDHKLPDGTELKGVGSASRRRDAEKIAAMNALNNRGPQPDDWQADAQLGDALIKLAAYLRAPNPAERSAWLQDFESDVHLATVFDAWHAQGKVSGLGSGRGTKFKATVVEAMVWRELGDRLLTPELRSALSELAQTLEKPS